VLILSGVSPDPTVMAGSMVNQSGPKWNQHRECSVSGRDGDTREVSRAEGSGGWRGGRSRGL